MLIGNRAQAVLVRGAAIDGPQVGVSVLRARGPGCVRFTDVQGNHHRAHGLGDDQKAHRERRQVRHGGGG